MASNKNNSPPDWARVLARDAVERIPAYADFVKKNKATDAPFSELPIATKKSYVHAYPLHDLTWPGKVPGEALHASSGSSGLPTYWYLSRAQQQAGGAIHKRMFRDVLGVQPEESTLAIVCFSMGIWVAGSFTASSLRVMQDDGWHLTIATPSIDRNDILSLLETFLPARRENGPLYQKIVLFGYPPFLSEVIGEARRRGIVPDPEGRIRIVSAGSAVSEEWRDRMMVQLGASRGAEVMNVYGSADAAVMGFETPETIWLRQFALKEASFRNTLLGPDGAADRFSLFTYDPEHIYLEEVDGELVITLNAAIPLIRYNIHDRGRVTREYPSLGDTAPLPLVVVTGRTDVALTFYSINIYPEHIEAALQGGAVGRITSGNFRAYTREVGVRKRESLHIDIECADGARPGKAAARDVGESVVRTLLTRSMEFRKLHESIGDNALPSVSLVPRGALELKKRGTQTFVSNKGKKPKMAV